MKRMPSISLNNDLKSKKIRTLSLDDKALKRYHAIFASYMLSKDFSRLKKYLSQFSTQDIEHFFKEKGLDILSWQINVEHDDTKGLDFIFNNIPHEAIKRVLLQENFLILKGFLDIVVQIENQEIADDVPKGIISEKFKFIRQFIDLNKIEDILFEKGFCSNKSKQNLEQIIDLYTSPTIPDKKLPKL